MTTGTLTARTVHVEHCMGTVFTIDVRDPGNWDEATADCVAWLHRVDALFSTYRDESEVSRIRRGELTIAQAHQDVREVFALCEQARLLTHGYFSLHWRGVPDPTGLVKGWAIDRASALLREHGSTNHAVNGGGDMCLAGQAAPGRAWRVGISDPHRPRHLLTVVTGTDIAVATSGLAERGPHIVDPWTGAPAQDLAAVTVTGPTLTLVDAYATAAVAMGADALRWLPNLPGHEAFIVTTDGEHRRTTGFGT
ncbi:MAG TPA: FAD:protein FMN transferase [Pseudonocardiaceae bacterium]|jgi:thiamine biosynthesis lipoprotein|nr:FAD:protein FMN transferase [Pseudonocardiaceae bacterium]